MRRVTRLLMAFVILLIAPFKPEVARGDQWSAPTKMRFKSANGKYCFEVIPIDIVKHELKPGLCKGILYKKTKKRGYIKVWQRYLINNISPVSAYVSPDGEYVVTLNEWADMDLLPIVVYGFEGNLVAVFTSEVIEYALRHECTISLSGMHWSGDLISRCEIALFSPQMEYFIIRSGCGFYCLLDLDYKELKFADDLRGVEKIVGKEKFPLVLSAMYKKAFRSLRSRDPCIRATAADWCGELKLKSALPLLKKLLKDRSSYSERSGKKQREVFFVAEAAKRAVKKIKAEEKKRKGARPAHRQKRSQRKKGN